MCSYGKEHNGHGECDGSQHGHTHAQNQRVVWVNTAVGVKQLCLHFT